VRLAIVSALAVRDHLSFNELKKLLKTTDGNLSVHARKLEEAGYVTCDKYFEGRVPKTEYRLTARTAGARALPRSHGSHDPRHAGRTLSELFFFAG
jgi:DNA-binding transcriptional ArsR family regulator